MDKFSKARLIVLGGSIIACFINIIDEINKGAGLKQIAIFSGVLLLFAIILIFTDNKKVLGGILCIAGFFMVFGDMRPGAINPGAWLLCHSMYIFKNKYFTFCVCVVLALAVMALHVFESCGPEDSINILVSYSVFLSLHEILYMQESGNGKEE